MSSNTHKSQHDIQLYCTEVKSLDYKSTDSLDWEL